MLEPEEIVGDERKSNRDLHYDFTVVMHNGLGQIRMSGSNVWMRQLLYSFLYGTGSDDACTPKAIYLPAQKPKISLLRSRTKVGIDFCRRVGKVVRFFVGGCKCKCFTCIPRQFLQQDPKGSISFEKFPWTLTCRIKVKIIFLRHRASFVGISIFHYYYSTTWIPFWLYSLIILIPLTSTVYCSR